MCLSHNAQSNSYIFMTYNLIICVHSCIYILWHDYTLWLFSDYSDYVIVTL